MTKLGKNITFPIKNADGTSFHDLVLHKSTSDSVVMSLSDKITGDVYYKNNALAVTMNEYIEVYKNPDDANETPTKFVLVNPPTIVREGMASENSQLKGMTKYSFTFYHPMYMLGNLPFADVAVSDDQKQYLSESKTFNWIGNAQDYVAKLNKNLQVTPFIVRISDTLYNDPETRLSPKEEITRLSDVLSFDNVMVADALKTFYDTFGIPFVVDLLPTTDSDYASGKRYLILMGLPSETIVDGQGQEFVFRFGQGVGLKNNSRTPRNNKIVTRVAGYGSEENIPYGYPQIRWYGPSDWTNTKNDESDPTAYPIYEGIVGGALVKLIKHPFTRTHLMPTIYETTVFNKVSPYVEGGNANPNYDPDTTLVDYYDATAEKGYPNPINRNAPSYESHEFEDIKPQLGSETGITSAVPQKWDGTTYVDDDHWDDTMNDDGEYIQSYFKVGLPILPFDLYACAAITQQMNVVMRSGACLGCTFPVTVDWDDYKANFFNANGVFDPVPHTTEGDGHVRDINKYPDSSQTAIDLLVKKENTTFGVLMPNVYQHPSSGDKIVFTGISLPQSYITMAQALLDAAMDDWMMENNVYYWDYPLKFDEDFLSKNTDILAQIRPNVRVKFMFANDELVLYVKQLSIKYGDKVLPQYDITLTDNIEATRNAIGQTQADLKGVHTGLDRIGQAVQEITRKDRIKPTGSPTLPVYFNGNNEPKEIEGLEVPNDVIAHRNILAYGGVAARGIPNLGMGAGGGQGDVTSIQFDSTIPYQTTNPYTAVDGLLRLPVYPSLAGMASQEWVAANFAGIGYESRVDAIEALIPSQATSLNQLADKAFVNSSIATATATYQGSYNLVSDLSLTTSATREQIASALASAIVGEDNNDYAFVEIPTSDSTPTQIASVERYKFNGTSWAYEYTLNNSGMTAAQWAAVNSGITTSGVALIYSAIQGVKVNGTLLTPDSNQIVNVGVPTALSQLSDDASHQLVTDTQITAWGAKYDLPSGGIPKTDLASAVQTSLGLADTALQSVRTLTIQKNGATIDTFDPTASANKTINISDVASASTLANYYSELTDSIGVLSNAVGAVTSMAEDNTENILLLSGRADELESYFTNGVANNAARLSNTTKIGDTNQPIYFTANGVPAAISYTIGRNVAANEDVTPYTPATNGNISVNNHTIGISMTVTPDPTSSGTDISFIASVSQDSYGKISATKKAVRAASASQSGIVDTLAQTFAGDKTFNGNIQSMKGIAAHGIANLAINAGGGSGDVTSIKFGNGSLISASDGLLAVPVGQGTSNGQINIGGQDVSVKGLGTFAYISSLAFADLTNKPTTLSGYGITDAVTSVVGRNGDVTTTHIADALTTAGYKLTDTDTKVTSAANHYTPESVAYTPTAGSWSWNSTTVVTGITKDDKGHIVGITTTKIANPNTDHYAWADITDKPATATRWPSWSEVTDKPGTFYTLPIASASVLGGIKVGTNLSINSSTGVLSATDTTYTNGTGLSLSGTTFSISQANVSTILNLLSEGASPATRDDYIIAQYAGGGTTTTSYHRRKLSNVFAALNSSDVTTALGYTPFNSANFTKANIKSTLEISDWALASTKPSYAFSEITGSVANNQLANSYIGIGNRQINLGSVLELSVLADDLALGSAASYAATNAVTKNSGALVTSGAVWSAIDALPEPMVFRGSLGTGGTITSLPVNGTAKIGDTYKVITAGTYASKAAKVGDTFICLTKTASANTWELIPSGDEPSGTVTSVAMSVPTGLSVSGSPITSSGTFAITYASGYAIPTTAKQSNWDTAYGWGNHASAGYVKTVKVGNDSYSPTNGVVSLPAYPYAVSELVNDLGFTANTGTVTSVTIKGSGAIVVDYETAITGIGTRTISHATSGATAGSYGDSAAQTPAYGGTFKVPYVTVDAQGHVTSISEHTVKIPASDNTWRPLGTGANDACAGNDSRLSDARTPVAHASSATTYGVGTTSNYGHVKLATGDMNGATGSDGVAVGKNHTHSQYALAANLGTASTHAHGDYVTAITYDSTNRKLQQSKGDGTATNIVTFGTNAFNSTEFLPLSGGTMANTNLVTNLNAEYLGGTKKADLFSALTNDNDQLSSTIGGTNKKVTVAYASRSTDTRTELLTEQELTYRQTAGGGLTYKPSSAVLKRVLGNTLVWNVLTNNQSVPSAMDGFTYSRGTHNSIIMNGTGSTSRSGWLWLSENEFIVGHKYYACVYEYGGTGQLSYRFCQEVLSVGIGFIKQIDSLSNLMRFEFGASSSTITNKEFTCICIDLTLFFNGNIPEGLTAETFERDYGYLLANSEYNAGQLINNSAKGLETVGFNQWDEEWEVGTYIASGGKSAASTAIRTKNRTPIVVGATYYFRCSSSSLSTNASRLCYYDVNGSFISYGWLVRNTTFTPPSGAAYFAIGMDSSYGTTYNHDICINLSDPNRNGQYEPHKKSVLPLFPLKCKAPNGNIVIITDAKSAGSVRDERVGKKFIRRVGSVDLGTLSWYKNAEHEFYTNVINGIAIPDLDVKANAICSKYQIQTRNAVSLGGIAVSNTGRLTLVDNNYSDASTLKTSLSGVDFYYALATPIEYEIIDEAPYEYPIDVLGTERIVSDELVAPFIADIQYGAEQRNVAYDINSLHSNALALKGRASVLEGYFTDGVANNAARLSNTSAIGSITKPVYFTANGVPSACSDYAGGTALTLNGSSKAANTASIYAPTGAGTSGQILKSTAGAPEWINQSAITAGALSTVSKTLFGNTYWTSGGVPTSIGTSSSPAALNYVTNIDSIAYFDRTNSRLGIGTSSPSYKLDVYGDIYASNGWIRTNGSRGWYSETYGGGWYCDDYTYVKTHGNRSIYTAADILAGGNIVGTKGVASQGIANLSVAALSGSNFVTQVKIGSTAYNPSDGVVSLPAYPTVPTALSGFTNDVGYITGITSSMVTTALGYTPAQSDTKNTTGADNTTSKIYLVGPTAQTSSNGNARTYSNSECYASGGYLYSKGKIVANRMETPQPQSGSDTITLNGTEIPSYQMFDINSTSYLTKTLNHPSSHSAQNGFSYILISNSTSSEATINMPAGCIAPASSFKIGAGKRVEISYFYNGNNVAVIMWSTALQAIN